MFCAKQAQRNTSRFSKILKFRVQCDFKCCHRTSAKQSASKSWRHFSLQSPWLFIFLSATTLSSVHGSNILRKSVWGFLVVRDKPLPPQLGRAFIVAFFQKVLLKAFQVITVLRARYAHINYCTMYWHLVLYPNLLFCMFQVLEGFFQTQLVSNQYFSFVLFSKKSVSIIDLTS